MAAAKPEEYEQLLSAEDTTRLTQLGCVDYLKIYGAYLLLLPIWLVWLLLCPLILLVMFIVGLTASLSLRRTIAQADALKEDSLVTAEWGTIRSQLLLPAANLDVAETWLMIPWLYALLPMLVVDIGMAAQNQRYFALLAMRARIRHEQWSDTLKTVGSWYAWIWHSLFAAVMIAQGGSRARAYTWENQAQGGRSYWWHAQGVFTSTHSIVDALARSEQPRTMARASFKAVVPHAFPPGVMIFLPSNEGPRSSWAEVRREFHQAWLDESGSDYQQRLKNLDGLIRESWKDPSLEGMAAETVSLLVSRCIFYVFFGVWVTEDEAAVLALWRGLASYFVQPRLIHRLAFNLTLYPIMSVRAQTLGIVRKYRLEPVFSRMNASMSPGNRRPSDVQLYDEVMFAIGFAGIGGTTAGAVSVGKFLMAQLSYDVSGGVDFGGRDQAAMVSLFIKEPQKFIQETCRISSPVGTFTTCLKQAEDLGILGGGLSPVGTLLAGVINMANLDPAVFPEPLRFDPFRPNLCDALTWNGKAFGADEGKYLRVCPGRFLAIEIISHLAHIALGAAKSPILTMPGGARDKAKSH